MSKRKQTTIGKNMRVYVPTLSESSSDCEDPFKLTEEVPVREAPAGYKGTYYGDANCGICGHEAWPARKSSKGDTYYQNCKRSVKCDDYVVKGKTMQWFNPCGATKFCTVKDPSVDSYGKSATWKRTEATAKGILQAVAEGIITPEDAFDFPGAVESMRARATKKRAREEEEDPNQPVKYRAELEQRIESLEKRYATLVKKYIRPMATSIEELVACLPEPDPDYEPEHNIKKKKVHKSDEDLDCSCDDMFHDSDCPVRLESD